MLRMSDKFMEGTF